MFEHRFRSPDPIERVVVDEIPMEFLYNDGDDYYFMNIENYEQTNLKRSTLGDAVEYLIPNLQISVSIFDGVPVGIELPQMVEMTVVNTEPGLKSATASSVALYQHKSRGLLIGNYLILDKLGVGGMGVVFKARHRRLGHRGGLEDPPPRSPVIAPPWRGSSGKSRRLASSSTTTSSPALDADEDRGVRLPGDG